MIGRISAAFVLGAGLGTRLRPLTEDRPKPLVPIFHKPLITFAFDHLRHVGVSRFVVNTHHRPEAYERLLGARDSRAQYAGCEVAFRWEPTLLDTAGGIGNVRDLLDSEASFIVHNGDVLADLDLGGLIQEHFRTGNAVTLGLRSKDGPLHVQFDEKSGAVRDIRNAIGGHESARSFLFTGIYILSPAIFSYIPEGEILSVIPVLLEMIRAGEKVGGLVLDEGLWFDLGTRDSYLAVHRLFAEGRALSYPLDRPWPQAVHPSAIVAPGAFVSGASAIGPRAEVGSGASLHDSILWEGAKIASSSQLESCIVRDGRHAGGVLSAIDI